jgi:Fe-S cluster biosynthesis and repair protein YggX
MTRQVQCVYLGKTADGLDYAPFPGALGQRIYNEISKPAWTEWVNHQVMLINEYRLTPIEPKAKAFLLEEMQKFLFGGGAPKPEGYQKPVADK